MKIAQTLRKKTYHYSGEKYHDATKNHYGWNTVDSVDVRGKKLERASVKDYILEILEAADEKGFEVTEFDITLSTAVDTKTRKDVEFDCEKVYD